MNEAYGYDHFGNITSKTGVGQYCYDASKTNRLTGVWSGANCTGTQRYTMAYDANGNVTNDGKRTFTYTAFDKPSRVTQGVNRTDFSYGPNRELYRRVNIRDNNTTDTLYIGGVYERTTLPSAVTEHKFYVGNAVITKRSNNAHDEFYLHKDNQGSTTSITNAAGSVRQQFIYDPWGKQYSVSTNSIFTTYSNPGTSKGYTGHNMVNDFEVIHMGGRTYNPHLGRFMQADPFVQAPANLQNYNRYSYVMNNPMSMTDPSGYFFKWAAKKVLGKAGAQIAGFGVGGVTGAIFGAWAYDRTMNSQGLQTIASVALNFVPYCQVWCSALFSAQVNYYQTGSLRAAFHAGGRTAATAGVFYGIGQYFRGLAATNGSAVTHPFGGLQLTSGQIAGQIAAHAIAGGVINDLQGGKFGHGFFSAGVTKGLGGVLLSGDSQIIYNTLVSATIGGTASVIAGGKFSNGAKTAAFQYLYNQVGANYKQIFKDVTRTWSEYWETANSLETELCNKYSGMDCMPLALGVAISGTGAGALVTGSARLAYASFGFSSTKWLAYDQSAEGLGWLAIDAATMGSGAFFRSAGLEGMDHVISVYSYLFQLPGNFNQQIFPQNNSNCSVPMRCE